MSRDELIKAIKDFNLDEYEDIELQLMSLEELKEALEDIKERMGGDF